MRSILFSLCLMLSCSVRAGVEDYSGTYQSGRDFQMQLKASRGKLYMLAAFHPCYRMEAPARRAHCTVPDGRLAAMPWVQLEQQAPDEFRLDDVNMRFHLRQDALVVEQDAQRIVFPHPDGATLHLQRISNATTPLPEPRAVRLNPDLLQDYVGVYTEGDQDIRVLLDHGVLTAKPAQGSQVTLLAESSSLFYTRLGAMSAQFERAADGKVAQLRWFMEGQDHVLTRQPDGYAARVPPNTEPKSCKSSAPGAQPVGRGRFLAVDQVDSRVLDATIPLCVYLPAGYADTAKRRYPVIYATDGEYIESLVALLEEEQLQAVVIGLGGFERRDTYLVLPGARDYFRFMVDEAMPLIEARYRVDARQRILSGHSLGGNFVGLAALFDDPKQPHFKHYLSSDGSFWAAPLEVPELIDERYAANPSLPIHLVLAGAGKGNGVTVREVHGMLRARRFKDLRLELVDLPEEDHNTISRVLLARELGRLLPRSKDAPVIPRFASEPVYLRGSMNNWGIANPLSQIDGTHFQVDLLLDAGRHEFKFGSQDFQSIDYGGEPATPELAPDHNGRLRAGGANMVLTTSAPARWRFILDASQPKAPTVLARRLP